MFGGTLEGIFSVAATAAAVLFTGAAIKLMDDFVDRRMDAWAGVTTWAGQLGDGALPYSMAALAIALLIDARSAGTLFLAAYSLGMAHELRRTLPSGLLGWHESVIALSVGALLGGPLPMAAALAAMVFVQCIDDLDDAETDRLRGQRSFVVAFGRWETIMLAAAALIVASALAPLLTTAVVVCTAIVEWLTGRMSSAVGAETWGPQY